MELEFATLKGTEKQVNWAKTIRKNRLKVWQESAPDSFKDVELTLSQQGVASWWIASKDKSLKEICSQLQGGAKPQSPIKKAAPSVPKVVCMRKADDEELWETVATATGFMRSGPTRSCLTGEVVVDATLPF
jgi:hypothetical protein